MATECWNCGKHGHFSRDCKLPHEDKKVNFAKTNSTNKNKYGNSSNQLYQTVEKDTSDEDDDDESDYGILDLYSSDDEEAIDVLNFISDLGPYTLGVRI